ncbi:MAG: ribosome-associated translation inhibitor RaiA [Planctomycetes bacterium]|nr:ribosome-associated translation inhibitor RaiA [Planctomycetota bacterium]
MNIEITGRHFEVPSALEEYARAKAVKVAKYLKKDVRVQVILEHEHDKYTVEMIVSGHRGPVIVGQEQDDEARAAIDLAIDKIEYQLRKFRGRRKDRKGRSMAGEKAPAGEAPPPAGEDAEVSYDDIIDEELNR